MNLSHPELQPRAIEVVEHYRREFGPLAAHFLPPVELRLDRAETDKRPELARPGVYVFFDGGQFLKVGRHLVNARKRALEHVKVPPAQGYAMSKYRGRADTFLLLLLLAPPAPGTPEPLHWVAALEIFLESTLAPAVKSRRLG